MAETTQPPLSGGTSPHAAGGRPLRFRPVARAALALFHRLAAGRLELTLPDGTTRTIEGTASGPTAALVLHRWRALGRLMRGGEVAFAEAYVDGATGTAPTCRPCSAWCWPTARRRANWPAGR